MVQCWTSQQRLPHVSNFHNNYYVGTYDKIQIRKLYSYCSIYSVCTHAWLYHFVIVEFADKKYMCIAKNGESSKLHNARGTTVRYRGCVASSGRVDEWTSGRVDEWTSGRVDEWTSGRVDEWTSGRVDEWTSGRVDEWTSGRVDEWTSGRVDEWTSGRVGSNLLLPHFSRRVLYRWL